MTQPTTTTWNIDPAHTGVDFAIRHLMISTVRGRFGTVAGSVEVDEQTSKVSKVDVTIDAASIDTRQEQRDAHLRSADFLDVARYPTIRFVSTRVEGDLEGEFKMIGDLTIHGTTHEVVLDATNEGRVNDPWGNVRAGFTARGKLKRSDFGLTWNQLLEAGGVAVGDELKISIDAELVRAAEEKKAQAA